MNHETPPNPTRHHNTNPIRTGCGVCMDIMENQPTLTDVEFILNRAYNMEQYSTTDEAKSAILRKLNEIYQRGKMEGIRPLASQPKTD